MLILLSFNLINEIELPYPVNAEISEFKISDDSDNVILAANIAKRALGDVDINVKDIGVSAAFKVLNDNAVRNLATVLSSFRFDTAGEFENLIFEKCNLFGCDPYQVIRVMYCESKGNQYAKNGRYYGLFQQDERYWGERASKYGGLGGADIYDPYAQIQVATKMFSLGMSYHWGCK